MINPTIVNSTNTVTVKEVVRDRDNNEIGTITIGTGYAIFRGLTFEEANLKDSSVGTFDYKGIIIKYKPVENPTITVEGTTYSASHTEPKSGDRCEWRTNSYDLNGVKTLVNIRGNTEGFEVSVKNG